jgi:hypothetical protein
MKDGQPRGAEVSRGFFAGAVHPLLSRTVPGLKYAAARLGSGSVVLGVDDAMSRDHDWGCRLTLLLDAEDRDQVPRISRILEEGLPERFGEFPVRFPVTWDASVTHRYHELTCHSGHADRSRPGRLLWPQNLEHDNGNFDYHGTFHRISWW